MVNRALTAALVALHLIFSFSSALAQSATPTATGAIDRSALINSSGHFRIGPDGSYWVHSEHSVRKLSSDLATVLLTINFGDAAATTVAGVEPAPDGSIYILASTNSNTLLASNIAPYPTPQTTPAYYLAKYDAQGKSQTYGTYLPGTIKVSAIGKEGSIYLAGVTSDPAFRVTAGPGFHQACTTSDYGTNCSTDAFVIKLDSTGRLAYSLIVGGSDFDDVGALAVDGQGAAYVAGETSSKDLNLGPHAFQDHLRGRSDMYVGKVRSDGAAVEWLTYLGGDNDYPYAPNDGCHDGFEYPSAIAVGGDGSVYIAGETTANDFPTTSNAFQPHMKGGQIGHTCSDNQEAVVARLSPDGGSLVYGTYLGGGESVEDANGIVLDANGNATVVGDTGSPDFPLSTPLQSTFNRQYADCVFGCPDGYITRISGDGTTLLWSTFLGGLDYAGLSDVALDSGGQVVVAAHGFTLATPGALNEGQGNMSLVHIDAAPNLSLTSSAAPNGVYSRPYAVNFAVENKNAGPAKSSTVNISLPPAADFQTVTASPSQGACNLQSDGSYKCELGDIAANSSATVQISGTPLKCTALVFDGRADYQLSAKHEYVPDNFLFRNSVPHSSLGLGIPPGPPWPADPLVNTNYVYHLVMNNGGPEVAPGVVVKPSFPSTFSFISATSSQGTCDAAGNCSLGDIPANAHVSLDYTLKFPHPGYYLFSTTFQKADSDCPPPSPLSPEQRSVHVTSNSDLALQVVENPSNTPLVPGQHAVWKLRLTNNGPDEALASLSSDQFYTTTVTINGKQTDLNWYNETLMAAGQSLDVLVDVLVPGLTSSQFQQDVRVYGSNDPNQSNNKATLTAPLTYSANLKTSATGATVQAGAVKFIANVNNNGLSDAKNVKWTLTVPQGESVTSVQGGPVPNSCTVTSTGAQCAWPSINASDGTFKGYDIAVTTTLHDPSRYVAVLNVSSDSPEADPSDNTFTINLSHDYGFMIDAGQQHVTMHNNQATVAVAALFGPKADNNVIVTLSCEKLPAGMSCNFNPATVNKSSPQSTLSISFSPGHASSFATALPSIMWATVIFPVTLLLARRRKLHVKLQVFILLIACCAFTACGGGGGATLNSPAGGSAPAAPQTPSPTPSAPAPAPTPAPTTGSPVSASYTIQLVATAGAQRVAVPLTVDVE